MAPDKAATSALVWVRGSGKAGDNALPYKAAVLVGNTSKDGTKTVQYATGGNATTAKVRDSELVPRNPPGEPRPDNCQLLHLNEACVLENVAARFDLGDIYTWTSHVLTAVNPYEALPLYADELVSHLPNLAPRDLPPHVFAVAELAVRNAAWSQSVIVQATAQGRRTWRWRPPPSASKGPAPASPETGALACASAPCSCNPTPCLKPWQRADDAKPQLVTFWQVHQARVRCEWHPHVLHVVAHILLEKVRIVSHGQSSAPTMYSRLARGRIRQARANGTAQHDGSRSTAGAKPTDPGRRRQRADVPHAGGNGLPDGA